MKALVTTLALLGGAAATGGAGAAAPNPAYGTVVSSTPVTVDVPVPHQNCVDQPGYVQPPTSGGGAVVGGILGGLAGNAVGAGVGRALATGAGAIAGALVGNGVEAANTPPIPVTTTNCAYSRTVESRVVGYDVYEFAGQRYATRTARDPGPRIALDVRPTGESPYDAPTRGAAMQAPPGTAPLPNDPLAMDPAGSYPVAAYPVAAYPAPPYPVGPYPYPPLGYGGAFYDYPAVPFVIEGHFGGGRGRRGR